MVKLYHTYLQIIRQSQHFTYQNRENFGSLATIYEMFTPEEVGCKLASHWNASPKADDKKITRHCVIYKQVMYRKSQKKH